jgi:4-amino-4-deoxy-L-arabinose transferase-like glycosyltransferase
LNSIESSWIRVVCTGASATHDDSHPSVLAFLASRIDEARQNLESMQEMFSAANQRTLLQGGSIRGGSPVRLGVVLGEGDTAAVAPRAGELVRLAAEVGDHHTAAATCAAWLGGDRFDGFRGHEGEPSRLPASGASRSLRAIMAILVAVAATATRSRAPRPSREFVAVAAIAVFAGALRLWSLADVPGDPFYDAAVRSMPLSLHNFLLGAYDPGGTLAVDKPPLDLWLQVLSTQLFGFGSVTLKLPPALAGTAAVVVLYDAVRRVFGSAAGLASALGLAVLPIAVLTARSDTMDAVAMLLSVVALWCLVRFAGDGRARWCYLAAAMMGLAFNVKLFEGLVALPALVLFGLLVGHERRVLRAAASAAVFVAVALSWLTMTLLFPVSDRPFAIGSTDGSAWNATFVFNGYDRIAGAATQTTLNATLSPSQRRPANNSELARSAVPIQPPALLRLFAHDGPLGGLRLGFVLLVALALGVPALIASVARARRPHAGIERAFGASLLLWLAIGFALFSAMARLHPRYTEGFTPAVAAVAGIGVAWAARDRLGPRLLSIAGALVLVL